MQFLGIGIYQYIPFIKKVNHSAIFHIEDESYLRDIHEARSEPLYDQIEAEEFGIKGAHHDLPEILDIKDWQDEIAQKPFNLKQASDYLGVSPKNCI